jgi:hypothetical protein
MEIILDESAKRLPELLSRAFPGCTIKFNLRNCHAHDDILITINDLAGRKFTGLTSFTILNQDGEPVAIIQNLISYL